MTDKNVAGPGLSVTTVAMHDTFKVVRGDGHNQTRHGDDPAYTDAREPLQHAATHADGGPDEIDVTGLSGVLADAQTALPHGAAHGADGVDPVNVGGLHGRLADAQTALPHAATHQRGSNDPVNVGGLSGLLADRQRPLPHAATHASTSNDPINVDGLRGRLADKQAADSINGFSLGEVQEGSVLIRRGDEFVGRDIYAVLRGEPWFPPEKPHEWNDEFTTAFLSEKWDTFALDVEQLALEPRPSVFIAGNTDSFAAPPANSCWYNTDQRPGWLSVQPRGRFGDSTNLHFCFYQKHDVFPVNAVFTTRIKVPLNTQTAKASSVWFDILGTDKNGNPSFVHYVSVGVENSKTCVTATRNGHATVTEIGKIDSNELYLSILKRGTKYLCSVNGLQLPMEPFDWLVAPRFIGVRFMSNNGGFKDFQSIYAVDFFRVS